MAYQNHHRHDQFTGVIHSGGGHHHNHHHAPNVVTRSYTPHVQVTTPHAPRFPVSSSNTGRYRYHYNQGNYAGTGALLIGSFIILPIIIFALIAKFSMGAMAASAGVAGAGAASAIALNAATFGIGALVLYGALGLVSLYSSAKECYSSDKNVFDMIKSRVVNEDGLSFKGVMKSIGAVLCSPFLLIGGLAGMGVKAAVNARTSKSSGSEKQDVGSEITGSYSEMGSDFLPQKKATYGKDTNPIHSKVFSDDSSEVQDLHLLNSQTSFTPLYPVVKL
ncbi:hypothetical protein [Fluoribacter gormanii]|uniref:Transmembrane protein n=1 Tax=Fluoribacter gormanii TaxID=464 RepID=A0A377GHK5_9GAMM|nr:hypothetical protein [Fluoribacter gormanii]KTD03276.1 transmembrane protein [Fluoribacter gormanii]SIR72395.1 hypothetical protein SAMN05421777_12143 [Fluoribacter gormanii]STO24228.1 Uncharacterised protein [Fluoribacter gormanii]